MVFQPTAWIMLLLLTIAAPAAAQPGAPPIVVLQFLFEDAIRFQAVSPDGTITNLGALPPEIRLSNVQDFTADDWYLQSPDNIAISPDQQYAAVSASDGRVYHLLVYRINGERVWSTPLESFARMRWTPDSSGFAFAMDNRGETPQLSVGYFDLQTQQVSQLATSDQVPFPRRLRWANPETLTLDMINDANSRSFMMLTRAGELTELLRLEPDDEVGAYDTLCEREWSERLQVFFMVVGCVGGAEPVVLEKLYTVDLQGNATLILSAPDEFRTEYGDPAQYHMTGVEVHDASAYVVTHEYRFLPYTGQDDDIHDEVTEWRVLRWRGGVWTEIISGDLDEEYGYAHPRISSDGRYLALGYYRWFVDETIPNALVIIDLEAGKVVRRVETRAAYSQSLTWFNHYQFLFASSFYGNGETIVSSIAQLVDLARLAVLDLGDSLDAPIWLPFDS